MSLEFWFTICLSFLGIALSFFNHITKKEKTGATITIAVSFIIAIIFFIIGLVNINKQKNPETFSNQLQTTLSLKESVDTNNNDSTTMFSNYFETHTPNNSNTYLRIWDSSQDKDIQGNFHQYEFGLKLRSNKYLYTDTSVITSDIHLVYNPNYKGNTNFSGKIVLSDECSGTLSSADISILVDGVEVWKSGTKLTGTTISPIEYSVDLKKCKEELIIRTTCYIQNNEHLEIGFF